MSPPLPPPLDRRAALRQLAAHAVLWSGLVPPARQRGTRQPPACGMHERRTAGAGAPAPAHPAPRAGVTAAHVLTAARLREMGAADAVTAFDEVRQIPQVVDGIRCRCGCADSAGHYSLLSCYEGDAMARECMICQGQGRMAFRLAHAGRTLDEIRAAVDARYG